MQKSETRDLALEGRLRMERVSNDSKKGMQLEQKKISHGLKPDSNPLRKQVEITTYHSEQSSIPHGFRRRFDGTASLWDISRKENHAHETIAISRIGASRIHARYGKMFDAARNAWNGHAHAILANQVTMAIEAGSLFLDLSIDEQDEEAVRFQHKSMNQSHAMLVIHRLN